MKKVIYTSMIIALFSLTSCLKSIVTSAVKDTPISNKVLMHSSPRVGDYAEYKVTGTVDNPLQGDTTVTLKIESKEGSLYRVVQRTSTTMAYGGFMNDIVIEILCDASGNVKAGYLIDKESNEKTKLKVAKPGDDAYNMYRSFSSASMKQYGIPSTVSVKAGKFSVKAITYKDQIDVENGTAVILLNSRVKFQQVAAYAIYKNGETGEVESKMTLELVAQGNKK